MRNMNHLMKGLFHMVEAIIAITMILTFLILLRSTLQPTEDTGLYQEYGFEALALLDKENVLRNFATQENFTGIASELNRILPYDVNESVEICFSGFRCVGHPLPDRTVYTASYVISGNETFFKPAEILLHMWRA